MCLFSAVYLFGVGVFFPLQIFWVEILKGLPILLVVCLFPVIIHFFLLQGEKTLWGGEILEMTKLCVYKISWKLSGKLSAVDIILKFKWIKLAARQ